MKKYLFFTLLCLGLMSTCKKDIAPSSDAKLSNLVVSLGTLTPAFSSVITTYTDSVDNSVTSITVTPTANQANATITVNGIAVKSRSMSGAISLNAGSNTIIVLVTAEDGTTTETYTISVNGNGIIGDPTKTPTITITNAAASEISGVVNNVNLNTGNYQVVLWAKTDQW